MNIFTSREEAQSWAEQKASGDCSISWLSVNTGPPHSFCFRTRVYIFAPETTDTSSLLHPQKWMLRALRNGEFDECTKDSIIKGTAKFFNSALAFAYSPNN